MSDRTTWSVSELPRWSEYMAALPAAVQMRVLAIKESLKENPFLEGSDVIKWLNHAMLLLFRQTLVPINEKLRICYAVNMDDKTIALIYVKLGGKDVQLFSPIAGPPTPR